MNNRRPRSGEIPKSPSTQRPLITDFVLQERLGSGSYAVVFKAFWKTCGETVAIKRIQKSKLTPASIENILLEIEILKTIKHEFIIDMKDFTWDAENIYLILEYAPDGDLSTFIKSRRRLPEPVCRRLLQQLGKALQFLRSKHIAHMDLKPKNILLSSSREPFLKIADFGFAQYLKSNDGASDMRGSPLYMAPEMFLSRVYDARVDLWSVGVILYECLFGRAPYSSRTIEELITKITDGTEILFPIDVKISEKCRNLLERLLKKDPNQRLSFEQFFDHPWLDFEHFPSEEHYDLAMKLCKTAAELDKKKEYDAAVKKYLAGLEYLVPILTYEHDEAKKKLLKEKVQGYMARTEELKRLINNEKKQTTVSSNNTNNTNQTNKTNKTNISNNSSNDFEFIDESSSDYLKRVFADQPAIVAALESGCTAEYMESEAHFKLAVEYYEVAIERLIRFTKGMPPSEKKFKLQRQISDWLANAELVNAKLKLFERPVAHSPSPSPPIAEADRNGPEASSMRQNNPFRSHW